MYIYVYTYIYIYILIYIYRTARVREGQLLPGRLPHGTATGVTNQLTDAGVINQLTDAGVINQYSDAGFGGVDGRLFHLLQQQQVCVYIYIYM